MARSRTLARRAIQLPVMGAGGAPAIEVFDSTGLIPIANGDASPSVGDGTDFGTSPYGTTVSKTYIIRNTGASPLTDLIVTAPDGYTVTVNPSDPVAAGDETTFTVRADASNVDTHAGNISISNNSDVSPYTFAITGVIDWISTNLLYLFDAASGVYSDAAMTIPATNGGAVRGWRDKLNVNNPVQAGASTLCPTYRSSVSQFNNRPAVEGDGGDYLQANTAGSILGNLNTYSLYVVFRYSAASGDRTLISEGKSDAAGQFVNMLLNGGQSRAFHSEDAGAGGGFTTNLLSRSNNNNDNAARLGVFRRLAAASWETLLQTWQEKTDVTPNITTTTTDRLTLFARGRNTIDQQVTAQIAFIAAYSSNADYALIEESIRKRFGICLTYFADIEKSFVTVGDSKTAGWNDGTKAYCGGFGYQSFLGENLETATGEKWRELRPRPQHDGFTTASIASATAADLALITTGPAPDFILLNSGANDVVAMPTEAGFKASLRTIFRAYHTKWPSAQIRVMRIWRRSQLTNCNSLATWFNDLITIGADATEFSPYVAAGPDERVFLENGDDGVTYTADGVHPNHAGYILTADEWQANMGY